MIVEVVAVVAAVAAVSAFGVQLAKWVELRSRQTEAEEHPPLDHLPTLVDLGVISEEAAASAYEAAYRAEESFGVLKGRAESDFQFAQLQLEAKRLEAELARLPAAPEPAKLPPDPNATIVKFTSSGHEVYRSDGDYLLSDGRVVRQQHLDFYWRETAKELSGEDKPIAQKIRADWDRQATARRLAAWKEKQS